MKAVGDFIIVKDQEVVHKNDLGLIISDKSDLNKIHCWRSNNNRRSSKRS